MSGLRPIKPGCAPCTLSEALTCFKRSELAYAQELPTLAILDTALQAACRILEVQYVHPGDPEERVKDGTQWTEEFIVDNIYTLAKALQSSLNAYYAAVRVRYWKETEADRHEAPWNF